MITDEDQAKHYVSDLCDAAAMDKLETLTAELARENERQNLVARATLETVWQRHIADSAQLLKWGGEGSAWLDLGSGAGFPGFVIAVMRPQLSVVLVESRKRRVEWLERMISELDLQNCRVEGARLQSIETFPAGTISARAFAPLDRLLALSARFSTKDTFWVLPKGRSASQEVKDLPKNRRKMFHVEQSFTDQDAGIVVGRGQWSKNQ